MKFRAKIFLAVLVTSALLVSATLVVALGAIQARSKRVAEDAFDVAGKTLRASIGDRSAQLKQSTEVFVTSSRLRGLIEELEKAEDRAALLEDLGDFFNALRIKAEFYSVRDLKGQPFARHCDWHKCGPDCVHPADEESWIARDAVSFGSADGHPCIAIAFPHDRGTLVWARDFSADLDSLSKALDLKISLFDGDREIYATTPGLPGRVPTGATFSEGGVHYRVKRRPLGDANVRSSLEIVLLSPTTAEDEERRRAMIAAGAALAVAVMLAAMVSSVVSRGISRPVETLVGATQQVAKGDYTAQVDIPGRDEMARLGTAFNDMTAGLRKRQEIMNKTLSRDVAEQMMKSSDLGGERREVTILFMDIRGFTSTTQGMDPVDVVEMLNGVLDRLAEAIARHRGNVNKYLGDGIMAMFGAPKADPDHAMNAVRAAIDMQKAIAAWNDERMKAGKGTLRVGIGVNTGAVLAGNVGSRERLEYTLIGEEVNLTSRICGKAGPGQIYITHTTRDRLYGKIPVKPLEPVSVKGLSYPVPVFLVEA